MTLAEQRKAARRSPLIWFAAYCRILDKVRDEITPKPNIAQIRLAEVVEYCLAAGIPGRAIMVKPRKVGISTFSVAIGYWYMRVFTVFMAFLADIESRSQVLSDMLDFIAKNDQFDWKDGLGPVVTGKVISLGEGDNVNHAQKFTAGNPNATIGETPQVLIATEAAHYPKGGAMDGTKTMTNTLNSIAKKPGTLVIIESTAAGREGFFPEMWQNAVWPTFYAPEDQYWKRYKDGQNQGDSGYFRVFVAWWEMEEYRLEINDLQRDHIQRTLTADERKGIQDYAWTHEQLAWRRDTIKNECLGKETNFKRDFPSSPDEPFNFSGSPRFDVNGMLYLTKLAEGQQGQSYKTGVLSDVDPVRGGRPAFNPTEPSQAWLKLSELPKQGCRYLIGGDVAEDKDMNPAKDGNEVKRDRHAFFILRDGYKDDRGTLWRPRIIGRLMPPNRDGHDLLAKRLHLMSLYFGGCPIAPEMNNHGLALARALKQLNANLFSQTVVDPLTQSEMKVYGHRTTEANRPDVIENLDKSFRTIQPVIDELGQTEMNPDALEIFDIDALRECGTFMIDKKGRAAASSGNHDDDVMGIAITYFLRSAATAYNERIVERVIPKWDYKVIKDDRGSRKGTYWRLDPKVSCCS